MMNSYFKKDTFCYTLNKYIGDHEINQLTEEVIKQLI